MKALVFQHSEDEGPGTLAEWFRARNVPFEILFPYETESFPSLEAFDLLVILGGAMNVGQEAEYPWLKAEKKFIGAWLNARKPVLGICLGGQLLAEALGGKVSLMPSREVGFHEVERTGEHHPALQGWPQRMPVVQWHEEQFSLPPGCIPLLRSRACAQQAFARDDRTLALQFHPESTAEWVQGNFPHLVPRPTDRFVQTESECMELMPKLLPPLTNQFFSLLDNFTETALGRK